MMWFLVSSSGLVLRCPLSALVPWLFHGLVSCSVIPSRGSGVVVCDPLTLSIAVGVVVPLGYSVPYHYVHSGRYLQFLVETG